MGILNKELKEVKEMNFNGHFNWYFFKKNEYDKKRKLSAKEVSKYLSCKQIDEAYESKRIDPWENVTYMVVGGFITLE